MKIERKPWSEDAVRGLGETLNDCEDLLAEQVKRGVAELWLIDGDSWMITRVEHFPGRKPELVVCCYKGRNVKEVSRLILKSAIKQGMGSVRYHTKRKGLNRLVQELGFEYMETIYHKVLEN